MYKVQDMQLTAGSLIQNYKESVKRILSNENAFQLLNSVKGTPAYWKRFLHEVLAMVKQFGISTCFLTLPCADLKWDELSHKTI